MPRYVMVLNDGETYTDLEGCKIIEIHEVETGLRFMDLDELVKITCNGPTRYSRVVKTFEETP